MAFILTLFYGKSPVLSYIASYSHPFKPNVLQFIQTSDYLFNFPTDRSNSVHSVTLNGVTKKPCENLMKNSEFEKSRHDLERGVASNENPPSGVVASSTKGDSDSNQRLLTQRKKFEIQLLQSYFSENRVKQMMASKIENNC